ncbi:MAG: lytic transglycosylase domain-containing protein [Phycisphaerales bacterium]|jgi:soluble lytic murein transglycosylase-like protein|nr:lytic transglycosylase domain-containing protein [Phycisphaerales bacterium]
MMLRRKFRRFYLRGRRRFYRRPVRWSAGLLVLVIAVVGGLFWPVLSAPTLEESPVDYRVLLRKHARKVNLPEVFVHKVVLAESSGRPGVTSRVGAKGLMQIMPAAETDALRKLKRSERGDLFDPNYNLLIGTTYLRMLTDRFDGDAYMILAAYHMGQTRVARHRNANPGISGKELVAKFAGPQTKAYCAKILQGHELQLPTSR